MNTPGIINIHISAGSRRLLADTLMSRNKNNDLTGVIVITTTAGQSGHPGDSLMMPLSQSPETGRAPVWDRARSSEMEPGVPGEQPTQSEGSPHERGDHVTDTLRLQVLKYKTYVLDH